MIRAHTGIIWRGMVDVPTLPPIRSEVVARMLDASNLHRATLIPRGTLEPSFIHPDAAAIATLPAGTTVTPDGLRLLVAAYHHLARPLTAEEARGVVEDGVLSVATVAPGAEFTVTVGEAGEG